MRRAGAAVLLAVLALGVVHEVGRYRGERQLARAEVALEQLLAGGAAPGAARAGAVERSAREAARRLAGDGRPLLLAGSARLIARDPAGALEWYARALAAGERAELDLNIGRAFMMRRDLAAAQAAFLRAGWLSPQLLDELPPEARTPLAGELARRTAALESGDRAAVPPPPL